MYPNFRDMKARVGPFDSARQDTCNGGEPTDGRAMTYAVALLIQCDLFAFVHVLSEK